MNFFRTHVHTICSCIYCIFGPLLFVGGFKLKPGFPHWTRVACWLAGFFTLVAGVLGLTIIFDASLSPAIRTLLIHQRLLMEGCSFGILILLFASGEFIRPKKP